VTGAAPYDHWFEWRPCESHHAFCTRVGLPPGRPYLLYLCSSKSIAPHEAAFVRRWVTELRAVSPQLRGAGVLVRPHPENAKQWREADLSDLEHVALWPPAGASPVDENSRAEYYDSIYHSAAVVGVNTSAQIESAIVGRGVYTVLTTEFRGAQQGTLHFRHLGDANSGLLHVAENFAEHAEQLEAALDAAHDGDDRCRRFIETFVRPHGLHRPATPVLVAALEETAARGRTRPDQGPWWGPLVRPLLAPVAARAARSSWAQEQQAVGQQRLKQQDHADAAARRSERAAKKQRPQ